MDTLINYSSNYVLYQKIRSVEPATLTLHPKLQGAALRFSKAHDIL